jgi:2-C-methyl-D-erythritol 4-phosphate cytidylyltransferase
MGGQNKKEYIEHRGTPVLVHAIAPFLEDPAFFPVVVTVPPGQAPFVRELLKSFFILDDFLFVEGGGSRQESVFNALTRLAERAPTYVLIHDGARPWVTRALIDSITQGTIRYGACIPVVRFPDSIKEIDPEGFVVRHPAHETFRGAQTPQGFAFDSINRAHIAAVELHVIAPDDAELYGQFCGRVFTVNGDPANGKITYLHDMERSTP